MADQPPVTLTRTPLNIPLQPVGQQYGSAPEDRMAGASAGDLARNPERSLARAMQEQPAAAAPAAPDPEAGMRELEQAWGENAQRNTAALARYLDSLPEAERTAIAEDPRANDPAHVQHLVGQALRPQPRAMTIAGIEEFMRGNRAAYIKDEALQARYRDLLAEREKEK